MQQDAQKSQTGWEMLRRLFLMCRPALQAIGARLDRATWAMLPIFRRALPFAVLLATIFLGMMAWFRTPWIDEAWFLDAGVELARGHGLQNHAMPALLDVTPFALNYPLFMLLLAAVIRGFGLNFYLVRGLCFVLSLGACWIFVRALRRAGILVSRTVMRAALLLLLISDGVLNAGSHARPECLTALVLALLLATLVPAWRSPAPILQMLAAGLLSALVPWCGLHMVIPLGLGLAMAWLFWGCDARKLLAVAAGVLLGAGSVYLYYRWTNSWDAYQTIARMVGGLSLLGKFKARCIQIVLGETDWLLWYPRLPRPVILGWLLVGAGCLSPRSRAMDARLRKLAVAALLYSLATFFFLAFFANAQAWYAVLYYPPVCVVFAAWLRQLLRSAHPFSAWPLGLLWVGVALLYGLYIAKLPRTWWPGMHAGQPAHARLAAFVRDVVSPEDTAISNEGAYYAVRPIAKDWYPLRAVLSLDDARATTITKLVLMADLARMEATYFPDELSLQQNRRLDIPRFLDHLGQRWQCSFREITGQSAHAEAARKYRVFARVPLPAIPAGAE